jgi:hypothetical protein
VVEQAADVRLGSFDRALAALRDRPVPTWDSRRHYSGDRERTRAYIFVVDTVNFSFWGAKGGYWRLAEGLRDAFAGESRLWEPAVLEAITPEELSAYIGGLPLMAERAAALRELGRLARDAGSFDALVQETAAGQARFLAERLDSFRDVATYNGVEVPFLKRAQITAADLNGAGVASFSDLDALTCFADYKLPQALRHLAALEYSERLARRVDDWRELESGEPAEVEIRAATVVAVERLRAGLAERGRELSAFEVDWMLWDLSQGLYPVRPHHRVRTIFY